MAWLLDDGKEPRLHEQRKLLRRRSFKRENHYRLKTDAEASLDLPDHARTLRQLDGRMGNQTVIDMAVQSVPYEAGRKFFRRFEVAAAGAGMARRPGEVRMRYAFLDRDGQCGGEERTEVRH